MSRISSQVFDTARGEAAQGVSVRLDVLTDDGSFLTLAEHTTDREGRVPDFLPRGAVEARTYRLTFDTGSYFSATDRPTLYPWIELVFHVEEADQPHHLAVQLSPFGYATHRG